MTAELTNLATDSADYDVLTRAVDRVKDVEGISVEFGVRKGGSSELICNHLLHHGRYRTHVCVDPYGSLPYLEKDDKVARFVYDHTMKGEAAAGLFTLYASVANALNLVWLPLRSTDFMAIYKGLMYTWPEFNEGKTSYARGIAFLFCDGEHTTSAVTHEALWFVSVGSHGAVVVFDDINNYDHDKVEAVLFENRCSLIEKTRRKASYVLNKDNK